MTINELIVDTNKILSGLQGGEPLSQRDAASIVLGLEAQNEDVRRFNLRIEGANNGLADIINRSRAVPQEDVVDTEDNGFLRGIDLR